MDFSPNRVPRSSPAGGLNQYALVVYIPDPLGQILDDLRRELVPGCNPHAHVSVLPPRPLACDPATALQEARSRAAAFEPFQIHAGNLQIFPATQVIYIDVQEGSSQLRHMHSVLTGGCFRFDEPFQYHPHVTLAQDLHHEAVPEVFRKAQQAWLQYSGNRVFRADRVVFVQNTKQDGWVDLEEIELRAVPVR